MQSRSRYVVVSILLLAVVAAIPLSHAFQWVWIQAGWDDRPLIAEIPISACLAYLIAATSAIFVLRHQPTYQLAIEVADELGKVSWPTRQETGSATMVVIVTVLICSAYLGVFDAFWLWITDTILGVKSVTAG